ncbi:MAG: NAD-dependent epimerase/dehydratase family protein [Mariniphaga sp.]|nr:NAD-dependent epimerase/dehydratase family protein [Mariniphaga sp.]
MVFVTGGTGMVGAHLLYDLVSNGEKVRALKRPGSNLLRTEKIFSYYSSEYQLLLQNIEWVDGDILDKDGLGELLVGVDQIYHTAAIVSFDPRDRETMIHNNVEGTANLVDLAVSLHIPRFCHVSSISAIGSPPEGIEANEDHPWRNSIDHSAYGESKYLSEMEVWRAIFLGLNAVIVNPSVIIGPGDWKSGSSMLFSTVWKGLKFYTKGGTGFVDVRDVTKLMRLLIADDVWEVTKNQRYILNAENIAFRDFFNQIAGCLHVKPPKYFADNLLLSLAFRLSSIKSYLTGSQPSITRETAKSANRVNYYDGSKVCRTIGFEYTPVKVSIRNNSQLFLKDFGSK